MAKAREITKRRKAVRNIRKITKVMQMVATARFQKSLKRAKATRPYVEHLTDLVHTVAASVGNLPPSIQHPLLARRTIRRVGLLVVTSNRGLAGAFNGNILRLAMAQIRELEESGKQVEIYVGGRKGAAYFRFARRAVRHAYTTIGDNPQAQEVAQIARDLMDDFAGGHIDAIKMVYVKFISVGQQKPTVQHVLPLDIAAAGQGSAPAIKADVEFSPDPQVLLADLLPTMVRSAAFQAFIDSAVSEQIARMLAMAAATENAENMSKLLTRDYNRARQSQITSELAELMGGVEAMK